MSTAAGAAKGTAALAPASDGRASEAAEAVAREELSGAGIRAAALAATVGAIAAGTAVREEHLLTAVRRELEKSRRPPTARPAATRPEHARGSR